MLLLIAEIFENLIKDKFYNLLKEVTLSVESTNM